MELRSSKPNFFLYSAVFCVNLLCINTAGLFSWASPSLPKLTTNNTSDNPFGRPITSSEESLIASLASLGSVVGTIIAGIIAEKIGRKKALILFSTPYFFCHIIMANARQIGYFYASRLIMGLAGGCVLSVLPSYVAEISEDSNRGALSSIFGLMNSLGHLLTFAVGPLVSIQTFAYIQLVPVTLFFVTFIPFIPESPYYFLAKDDNDQAMKSLKKIRSNENVEKELLYLKDVVNETKNDKVSWKDITSSVAIKKGFLVCCGLLFFQQSMGIGVMLLYLQPILEASGNIIPSYIASMTIGIIQMISCGSAIFIIELVGRKILLHISSVGSSLSLFTLGTFFILSEKNYNLDSIFWLPVTSLISFYIFFNIGYATIPWSICGELFTPNVKSLCAGLACALCLIYNFVLGLIFPFLRDAFGMGGVFYVFASISILASIFVAIVVPETKGKSFQEIQYKLGNKQKIADGSRDYDSS